MKKILLFIFLFSPFCIKAQMSNSVSRDAASKKKIAEYMYTVTYRFTFALDTVSNKRYKDLHNLEIGNGGLTRYYSRNADLIDSIFFKLRRDPNYQGALSVSRYLKPGERCLYQDLYFNYPQKGNLLSRFAIVDTEYEYSEEIPQFVWEFRSDTASILGYPVKVAVTAFKGRKYKLYFTENIPMNYGPWKFRGLPGMILKVEELSGLFDWEAIGLSQIKGDIYIYDPQVGQTPNIPAMKIRKTTRDHVRKLQKMAWETPLNLLAIHGKKIAEFYIDGTTGKKVPMTQKEWVKFREKYAPPLELE